MTDEPDWNALKRARAAAIEHTLNQMCAEHGWDRGRVTFHADPNPNMCYCDCAAAGPCQHRWDGPWRNFDPQNEGYGGTITCSLCGYDKMAHDMWLV
jgi:hypothetical protein